LFITLALLIVQIGSSVAITLAQAAPAPLDTKLELLLPRPSAHAQITDADFSGGDFDHTEVISDSNHWSADVKINDDVSRGGQYAPSLAVDSSGNIYAAWKDERNEDYDIYFAKSTDGGATWSTDVKVNDDTDFADQYAPSLAVDGSGNVYVAWSDDRNWNYNIYFAKSSDGGVTWSTDVKVNDDTDFVEPDHLADQYSPSLAVDGSGNLYVAWADWRNGDDDIYFAKSTDSGATWSTDIKVNDDTGSTEQHDPSLAVDGSGNVYVAWEDGYYNSAGGFRGDIYFAKSTDGGATWSANVQVNDDIGLGEQYGYNPSMTADGSGNVYVAWEDGYYDSSDDHFYADIYFAKSTDGGTIWSANTQVNNDAGFADQYAPSLAVDSSGNIYAAWKDERNKYSDIYFAKSTDGGATWSTDVTVDNDTGLASEPSLAVNGSGNLYVAWDDRSWNYDIYFAKSTDGGATWSEDVKANDDAGPGFEGHPSLAVDGGGNLYAVWEDGAYGSSDYYSNAFYVDEGDIYFAKSTDSGATWSASVQVDDDDRWSDTPNLAVDSSGNIYVAWTDMIEDNIYFAKSTDGGTTWSADFQVNDDAGSASESNPSLAVDGNGSLYMAWEDQRNGEDDIYFAKSTDGGATWSANVKVYDTYWQNQEGYNPSLAVDGNGNVYVAWENNYLHSSSYIYFAKSTDGGATWDVNVRPYDSKHRASESHYSLAVDSSGNRYVAWADWRHSTYEDDHPDIYFGSFTADGWNSVKIIDDTGLGGQRSPSLAVDGCGNLCLAWQNAACEFNGLFTSCYYDIYFAYSTDGGATWQGGVKVNDDAGPVWQSVWQYDPNLVVDGSGNVYVAWVDPRNGDQLNYDIYFARRVDSTPPQYGAAWISASSNASAYPGEVVTHTLQLENAGNVADTFTVTVSGNAWTTVAPTGVGPLAMCERAVVNVRVQVPSDASKGDTDTAIVSAVSVADPSEMAVATLVSYVGYHIYLPLVSRSYKMY